MKKGILIHVAVSSKIQNNILCEKDYISNFVTCSCENGKYLASATDNSVITCDVIINVADNASRKVSANVTCTASINAANTVSVNFNDKNVGYKMNCCILHTVLLSLTN